MPFDDDHDTCQIDPGDAGCLVLLVAAVVVIGTLLVVLNIFSK